MLEHLQIGRMHLVVRRGIAVILLHHREIKELVLLIIQHRLVIARIRCPAQFLLQPVANAIHGIA